MKSLLLRWLILTVAVLVAAHVVPGFHVSAPLAGFILAVVLSLLNALLRPLLLLLTLPVNILSLGLFTLVINGFMLWIAGAAVSGVKIDGFGPAFWGALVVSLASMGLNWLIRDADPA